MRIKQLVQLGLIAPLVTFAVACGGAPGDEGNTSNEVAANPAEATPSRDPQNNEANANVGKAESEIIGFGFPGGWAAGFTTASSFTTGFGWVGGGVGWAPVGWAGVGWAGVPWAGVGWAGVGWAPIGWAGVGWAPIGWAGGIGWAPIGWAGCGGVWAGCGGFGTAGFVFKDGDGKVPNAVDVTGVAAER